MSDQKSKRRRKLKKQKKNQLNGTKKLDELKNNALHLHKTGRLDEAESRYRQIIAVQPENHDIINLCGLACYQQKNFNDAVVLFQKAVRLKPDAAYYHVNMGNALYGLKKNRDALVCYTAAVKLQPGNTAALFNCGITSYETGDLHSAVDYYTRTLAVDTSNAYAHNNLGNALRELGKTHEAAEHYRRAIQYKPDYAFAHNNIANILKIENNTESAFEHYKKALKYNPDYADAHNNIGVLYIERQMYEDAYRHLSRALRINSNYIDALFNMGRLMYATGKKKESLAAYRSVLALDPNEARAHCGIGIIMQEDFKLEGAVQCYRASLKGDPDNYDACNNLAVVLKDQGRLEESYELFDRVLQCKPDFSDAHSNLLLNLHYHKWLDDDYIFNEHRKWGAAHQYSVYAEPGSLHAAENRDDRIRIGYVSPDFREHSVAYFAESFLACHDHDCFHISCYADLKKQDSTTRRLQGYADSWRTISRLSDEEAVSVIRDDGIDILVDLAGHTAHNRMKVFARKPAPVQISYIGYPDTTGLTVMDYRITDEIADPTGVSDRRYTENLIRMSGCFLCYTPPPAAPEPAEAPFLKNGYVTFGSFNNCAKITSDMIEIWIKLLAAVPGARLILKSRQFSDRYTREVFLRRFNDAGADTARIECIGFIKGTDSHLKLYDKIDISLDTFPYNGTTTTCESLWMGVPVVSLAGTRHSSRVSMSLLHAAGVAGLVADTDLKYCKCASDLAYNYDKLIYYRNNLRNIMKSSVLMDHNRYTKKLEGLYRMLWERHAKRKDKAGVRLAANV